MKKQILVLITMLISFVMIGQNVEATTSTGKKVTLKADGTWAYTKVENENLNMQSGDCSKWILTETDKMTGKTTTAGAKTLIVSNDGGKKGFGILMLKGSGGNLIVSIQSVGGGNCVDENSKINVLFTDDSRLELTNNGKFNCKGNATLYFGGYFGKKDELKELKSKRIQTMRVWTNDSFVEKDFTTENQNEFLGVINCLTD